MTYRAVLGYCDLYRAGEWRSQDRQHYQGHNNDVFYLVHILSFLTPLLKGSYLLILPQDSAFCYVFLCLN